MRELNYSRIVMFITALSILSVAVLIYVSSLDNRPYYYFLVWNLFLAWLPFVISSIAYACSKRFRNQAITLFLLASGLVWLLLLPNTHYILTDLVHLTNRKNAYMESGHISFNYWFDLVTILLFSWIGLVLGFVSMYQFHYMVRSRVNAWVSWLFVLMVSLLAGYGVLLGREYRLNSWDVLTDISAIRDTVLESLHKPALLFTLLFALIIAVVYVTFYLLVHQTQHPRDQSDPRV